MWPDVNAVKLKRMDSNLTQKMDYASLIVPLDTLAPFEEYVEPYCAETTKKIEELQRKMQVLLKRQGIQKRSEIRSIWPGYSSEYKNLLVEAKPSSGKVDDGYESEDEMNILSTSTENDLANNNLFPRFSTSVSSLEEEIMWKINFSQGSKVKDTKIFFFGSILFRLSFGLHESTLQYFLHLSVAEPITRDVRVYCKYRIHDPTTEQVLMTQVAESNYTFRAEDQTTAGIDSFAGPEIVNYLDGFKRLLISVMMSTELGPQGEMMGVQLDHGPDISPFIWFWTYCSNLFSDYLSAWKELPGTLEQVYHRSS